MDSQRSTITNYINGQQTAAIDGATLENTNPATGRVYSTIPRSQKADVDAAYAAAKAAFPAWSKLSINERSTYLLKIAERIEAYLPELAAAESRDNGKAVALATHVDIPRAVANFRFFATAIEHFAAESHAMAGTAINYTLRQPLGVVGCISPWNLPLYLFSWKIAPALATGNCVVAKPSEVTPYTAYLLGVICEEVGLPKGVLNIVHGLGGEVGQSIVEHPSIKAISFTGGTETGKRIAATAAPMFKKLSLELGGKNPTIIFADADLEDALKTTMRSAFANNGQICLCGSRILVERSVYADFLAKFVAKTKKMQLGDPADPTTKQGALVSKAHLEKVLSYIDLAKAEGGTVACGGEQVHLPGGLSEGAFLAPTIITGLAQNCRTNQEEIFGPVVTVQPFDTEEEALELANGTHYGLAANMWTSDIKRVLRMSEQLDFGIVWVNCWMVRDLRTPFGGAKQSGVGREGGFEALRFFTEPKNVCLHY